MKNNNIRLLWENFISQYGIYFKYNNDKWINNMNILKKYIDENKKRPSSKDKDEKLRHLGKWITTQISQYNKKSNIMKNIDNGISIKKYIRKIYPHECRKLVIKKLLNK